MRELKIVKNLFKIDRNISTFIKKHTMFFFRLERLKSKEMKYINSYCIRN